MSFKVDKNNTLLNAGPEVQASKAIDHSKARTGAIIEAGVLPPLQQVSNVARSPALDSLLAMAKLQSNSASLTLSLAEVIEETRDTSNLLARKKIDQLMNSKLSFLKDKQERLELAQKKFDEAEKFQAEAKMGSWLRLIISTAVTVVGIACMFTGVASGIGLLMLGAATVFATLSTANEVLVLDNGKGIGGRLAQATGASKQVAEYWDIGVSVFLGIACAVLLFPAPPAASAIIVSVDLANGWTRFKASTASAEGMDLISVSKRYEAIIQDLSGFVQQDTDSLVRSNDRTSDMLASLLKTFSDVSGALTRVRFAS